LYSSNSNAALSLSGSAVVRLVLLAEDILHGSYLPLTGGTLTGPLNINESGSASTGLLMAFEAGLTTGNGVYFALGAADTNYNGGYLSFNYTGGAGSLSNSVEISVLGTNGLTIDGNSNATFYGPVAGVKTLAVGGPLQPGTSISAYSNTASPVAQLVGDSGHGGQFQAYGYGGLPATTYFYAGGTQAAPTALGSSNWVGWNGYYAYDGAGWTAVAQFAGQTGTYVGPGNVGGGFTFQTRQPGASGAMAAALGLDQNQNATVYGNLNIVSGKTYQVAGVPLAAANLSNGVTGTGAVVLATSPALNNATLSGTTTAATVNATSLNASGNSIFSGLINSNYGLVVGPRSGSGDVYQLYNGGGTSLQFYDNNLPGDLLQLNVGGLNLLHGTYQVNGAQIATTNLADVLARTPYTPTVYFATAGDSTFAYTVQNGAYVKVGPLVFFWLQVSFTPTYTTAAGLLSITLPPPTVTDGGVIAANIRSLVCAAWPAGVTSVLAALFGPGPPSFARINGLGTGLNAAGFNTAQFPSGAAATVTLSGCYF
jgi:hypothetical protein